MAQRSKGRWQLGPAQPMIVFWVGAFGLSWLVWVPLALDQLGWLKLGLDQGLVEIIQLFGTLGPAAAATLAALAEGGWRGAGAVWGQLGRWRVGGRWFAAAGLVYPALVAATVIACRL